MALLKHLNIEKSAQGETSAMQHPASQPDHTSIIPGHLIHTIIRPALLLILLLFSSFSALAYDCKVDGIYYDLNNDDKTASVTYMYFYYSYSDNKDAYVGNIIIPESTTYNGTTYSVTSIGYRAFSDCSGLTSVTIPNSVTSIDRYAFSGCSGLTSVTIPNSVTSIGDGAFADCSGLTSVTIPNSVTSIGYDAFSGCSGLTSVTIPNSVTSIGSSAFSGCSGLTSVTIPNSVISIGERAFRGCSGLTSVTIPNSVTSIGYYAFSDCSRLTSVTIPNSVTSIGESAFSGCSGLTSVTIPNSVTFIGGYAFRGCSGLTSVTIPNSVTSIGESAFSGCTGLTSVTIPNSVTSIGESAFSGCTGLTSVTFNAEKCTYMGSDSYPVFNNCINLTTLNIGNKVTTIPNYAFYDCTGLHSLTIGTGVLSIGQYAIGYYYDHGNIKKMIEKVIWLPNTPPTGYSEVNSRVSYVANDLYTGMSCEYKYIYKYLSSLFEVDGIRYVPVSPSERTCDAIDCTYNQEQTDISLCKTVSYKGVSMTLKDIKPYTCYNNTHITKVIINYEGNIGNYAFYDCSAIISADITAESIGDYAFKESATKNEATFKIVAKTIGETAFSGCSKMTKATLGESLTSIGGSAFSGCTSLEGITIPNNVESIGQCTFEDCSALSYAKIGSGLKAIPYSTFSGCASIPSITIPKNVTEIGNYAFSGCKSLADVYIEDREDELSLGSNGSSPLFSGCPLKTVYIGGNISYPTSSDNGYSPFYRNTSLEKVIITDKETEISENEFYGCTGLKYITMSDGIEKIGDWAFSGCSSLDFFRVGSNVKTIGKEAFSDCTAMTKLNTTAPVPPTCGSQALDDINKWTCKLFVNKESIDQYKAAEQWKEFFFISEHVGVDDVSVDTPDALYEVYNLQGVRVGSGMREAEVTADALPHGVYILVSPQGRKKLKI